MRVRHASYRVERVSDTHIHPLLVTAAHFFPQKSPRSWSTASRRRSSSAHTAPASLHLIVAATVHAAPLRPTVLLRSPEPPSTRLLRSLEASTLLLSLDHHK
ncbi:hypothetical protein Q3G72_001607 [Acer saccharum]|nr:hypothetical protein Q3G72_001607 [Acer saccharum]